MSTIAFFCIPAHGHTNPTLGVVRELVSRGHQVIYYSYAPFKERIEAAGAQFIPCDSFDAELKLSRKEAARIGKDLALSTRVLVDTTLALDDMVCRDMERLMPDCIVADSMAAWGKAAALKLGIPFISSTTTFAFNQHSAKIMKQSPEQLIRMLVSMPRIQKDIARLKRAGFPVKSVLDLISNDDRTHTIVYTSPQFQPCAETFSPAHYTFAGPSIRPAQTDFHKRRDRLVYISMGTVNNAMLPLYRACINALEDAPYQVVLSVGSEVDLSQLGPLPEHIEVYPHVDQIAVLRETDAFLTHCGMNSASEALYFSVPLAMLPQTSEQGGVARRVQQLGAGLMVGRPTPNAIRQAVDTLLTDDSYRQSAAAISAGFKQCTGAKGAADKILSVAVSKTR